MEIEFVGNFLENMVDLAWEFLMIIFSDFIYNAVEDIMDETHKTVKENAKILD